MPITRRRALGAFTSGIAAGAAEQVASAQPAVPAGADEIILQWLGGGPPPPVDCGVSWGVSFPKGKFPRAQAFSLHAPGGEAFPVQSWPLATWPDGTLKWAGFAASAGPRFPKEMRLRPVPGEPAVHPETALKLRETNNAVEIDTGRMRCRIPKTGGSLIESIRMEDREVARNGRMVCRSGDFPEAGGISTEFTGVTGAVTVEQGGPVRAVVKVEGLHHSAARDWLPFTVRLYFYAQRAEIRLVHTIVFDGDAEKDFIRGLGLAFAVPMREQVHNRHVRFGGEEGGVWSEPVQPLTGRRALTAPGANRNLYPAQLDGQRIPNREAFDSRGRQLMADWAVWNSYKLVQATADGFTIQKRANEKSCWLDAGWGKRAAGLVFAGDVSGGLGAGLRNMWQSYPAALEAAAMTAGEAAGQAEAEATLRVWLWSPDAAPMDLRHYDTRAHGLEASYEDVQPGFSTPHGVARTSELMLFPSAALPSREEAARQAALTQDPPQICALPAYVHSTGVFGIWSLPDRGTAAKASLETRLDAAFDTYHREVEQRHWYGFWNYGDVMHQHDGPRHTWRYDVGGFAWDNTELGTDVWLWYSYLRTGRADMFRMAEAMTRHTSEVDVYHLGRFAGLGSRHNVRHWGCGAKEARISQAAYRRFFYYLTTDERTGDLMRAVVDVDHKLTEIDPMRLAAPVKGAPKYPARVRGGPDWLAFVGNWMTEWERTGALKYRDKILAGMDSIAAMPYGFLTGPDQLYGYEPDTGKLYPLEPDGFGTYNLATIMGGGEVVFELNELIQHEGWNKAWLQYCRLHTAPKSVVLRDRDTGAEGGDGRYARPGRLSAYLYRATRNPAFARKAWSGVHLASFQPAHVEGAAAIHPIDEIPGLSTNSTAQGCLEAIEVLEMCGDAAA